MSAAPSPTHVSSVYTRAMRAVHDLGALADERQVLVEQLAAGTRSVRQVEAGVVELVVRVSVDTLQAIEDAAEYALPEAEPLDRRPVV